MKINKFFSTRQRILFIQNLYCFTYNQRYEIAHIDQISKYSKSNEEDRMIVEDIINHLTKVDSNIQNFIIHQNNVKFLPNVILNLLRIAIYEISKLINNNLSFGGLINDYMEIAKQFAHYNEIAFINAILVKFIETNKTTI
jgi:transcription termination factor NusB